MTSFKGKVVVVTGAVGGIGRCLVKQLRDQGAVVWAWDIQEKPLADLETEFRRLGGGAHALKVDISRPEEVIAARDRVIKESGKIDYWFNNAGVVSLGEFMSKSYEDFQNVIRVNLEGTVFGTRAALEVMETQGSGTIVNIASVAGHLAAPFLSAYVATKHAVVGFTRSLQAELRLASSNTNLILVSPGFVDTDMIAKGKKIGFPEYLSFLLATPENVATEILSGVLKGKAEINPTLNGRVMLAFERVMPRATIKGSKILLTKSVKDFFLNRIS